MEYLAENYRVLSPEYLEYCLVRGRPFPNRSVALMFDGGYAELLYTVDEVLAQFDLSAIAFVPSSHLLEKRSRWYDELEELLIAGSSGDLADLVIDGNPVELCLRTQYDRLEAYGYLLQRLATMSPPQQREVLDQLIRAIGQTGGQFDDHRMLDAEELQRLESSGRIRIAGTTHHHVDPYCLSVEVQRSELQQNKAILEEVLHHPIRWFSSPFWSIQDDVTAPVDCLGPMGFAAVFSSSSGTMVAWTKAGRRALPKATPCDRDLLRFHQMVSRSD